LRWYVIQIVNVLFNYHVCNILAIGSEVSGKLKYDSTWFPTEFRCLQASYYSTKNRFYNFVWLIIIEYADWHILHLFNVHKVACTFYVAALSSLFVMHKYSTSPIINILLTYSIKIHGIVNFHFLLCWNVSMSIVSIGCTDNTSFVVILRLI
jgi:hypothetical protein